MAAVRQSAVPSSREAAVARMSEKEIRGARLGGGREAGEAEGRPIGADTPSCAPREGRGGERESDRRTQAVTHAKGESSRSSPHSSTGRRALIYALAHPWEGCRDLPNGPTIARRGDVAGWSDVPQTPSAPADGRKCAVRRPFKPPRTFALRAGHGRAVGEGARSGGEVASRMNTTSTVPMQTSFHVFVDAGS